MPRAAFLLPHAHAVEYCEENQEGIDMLPIDNAAIDREILGKLLVFKNEGKTNVTSNEIFPRKMAGEHIAAVESLTRKGLIKATPAVMCFTNMEITALGENFLSDNPPV